MYFGRYSSESPPHVHMTHGKNAFVGLVLGLTLQISNHVITYLREGNKRAPLIIICMLIEPSIPEDSLAQNPQEFFYPLRHMWNDSKPASSVQITSNEVTFITIF